MTGLVSGLLTGALVGPGPAQASQPPSGTAGSRLLTWGGGGLGPSTVPAELTSDDATIRKVAVGDYATAALLADDRVVAWGAGDTYGMVAVPPSLAAGEVPLKDISLSRTGLALTDSGEVVQWGNGNGFAVGPPPSDLNAGGRRVTAISAGTELNLALTDDGRLHAWGFNGYGQLNVPIELADGSLTITSIDSGDTWGLVQLDDGSLRSWGDTRYDASAVPLDLQQPGAPVVAFDASVTHAVALLADGTVRLWGSNSNGQTSPPTDLYDGGRTVVAAAVGDLGTMLQTDDGRLTVFGGNGANPSSDLAALEADGYRATSFGKGYSHQGVALARFTATEAPTVVGPGLLGEPLTATGGSYTLEPESTHYQWYVDGVPVGTDSDSYTPVRADVGKAVTLTVTVGRRLFDDVVTSTAPHRVVDPAPPTITATTDSAPVRGWYRGPVTVTFSCTPGGAPLAEACPPPVTLGEGSGQSLTRRITATDGRSSVVELTGLNVDTTAPAVRLSRVRPGVVYRGVAPRGRCHASDRTSGVAQCVVTHKRNGRAWVATASATDRVGHTSVSSSVRYRLLTSWIVLSRPAGRTWRLPAGRVHSLMTVTDGTRPEITTPGVPGHFVRAARRAGQRQWLLRLSTRDLRPGRTITIRIDRGKTADVMRVRITPAVAR